MDRINKILNNEKYKMYINKLEILEKDRVFCKHNMEHFLDVARIAYIQVLEQNLGYSKEIIYAIALLHDIGRVLEYEKGIPHDEASVILAKEILKEGLFTVEEQELILSGINNHRRETKDALARIIYKSDKLSRICFSCSADSECYWSIDKKNKTIII